MVHGEDQMPTVLVLKRPNHMRWEFILDGQTAVQAYDGTTGGAIMPFAGQTEPQAMSAEDLKDVELQADIDGLLRDSGPTPFGSRIGDTPPWKPCNASWR